VELTNGRLVGNVSNEEVRGQLTEKLVDKEFIFNVLASHQKMTSHGMT
jgi:hypothetical protein